MFDGASILSSVTSPPASNPPAENYSRLVWQMAGPAVAVNSLQVINVLLDRFFIGHLPQAALTAQSGSMNLTFLLFSLAVSIATGTTALVSRAYGAGDRAEVRQATQQSLRLAVVCGAVLCLLSFGLTPFVARLVLPAGDQAAYTLLLQFVGIYSLGLPATFIIQTLAASMRGVGDAKSPMRISMIHIGIHVFLNFVLIFPTRPVQFGNLIFSLPGAGWGLPGAGVALALSAWISALLYIAYARRTSIGDVFQLRFPRWDWTLRIGRIALPSAGMSILRVFSLTAFTIILARTPSAGEAVAALGIAFAIEGMLFMPAFGLSTAASALVGQSLGAKKPERARRIGWVAGHHAALLILALVVPVFLAAPKIASVMISETQTTRPKPAVSTKTISEAEKKERTRNEAVHLLRWLCLTEVFFGYAMVLMGAVQGAGDIKSTLWITIVSLWLLRVPLAAILGLGFGLGATGCWIAMSGSQAIQGILAMVVWHRGKWQHVKV